MEKLTDNILQKGLVQKSISGDYSVIYQGEIYVCKPRGVFRHKESNVKVGDYVDFDPQTKIITKVYPRKNDLIRPVIANIDKAFLVISIKEPDLNLNLLDKMISILEYNNIEIIIIFTKNDLLDEIENIKFDTINKYYQKIGYKTFVSSKENFDKAILDELKNSVCVLTGQSGVGKSTLLNNMDKALNLKTNEISKALGRGKHTTRHIELFPVASGYLADSPGFGNVNFDEMDELTFSQTFIEFFKESEGCKFNHCTHVNEPKCIVKEKVLNGEILKSRYDNYLLFINEIKEAKKRKY